MQINGAGEESVSFRSVVGTAAAIYDKCQKALKTNGRCPVRISALGRIRRTTLTGSKEQCTSTLVRTLTNLTAPAFNPAALDRTSSTPAVLGYQQVSAAA